MKLKKNIIYVRKKELKDIYVSLYTLDHVDGENYVLLIFGQINTGLFIFDQWKQDNFVGIPEDYAETYEIINSKTSHISYQEYLPSLQI